MAEPIRILQMIGSLNIGGSQSMIVNLYKAIDRTKVQFDFIIDRPGELYYGDTVKKLGAKIYEMPTFTGSNFSQIIKEWDNFFRQHPEYKVLHSHVRSYASIYIPIAKKHGLKTIIHSHSTSNGSGIKASIKKIMQYPLRFEADYFFGCSKEAGEWLFGKKIVEGEKYHMLQNAIDTKKYSFSQEIRDKYRKEFGAGNKTKIYIHVGRFHEAKNHMFLLEVFSRLLEINTDSLLLLVGDGTLRERIEQKIASLNMQGKVIVLGRRNDVQNILQAADCFLFPSNWEGLPVTVVEAQAAGLPCFVSENVTKDVNVSPLVTNLPINMGTAIWINAVANANLQRKNVTANIVDAGFDINSSAQWLQGFYRGLTNE